MPKIHSHYENLKVSRDAPAEVIRAAYRTLAGKYHPDRNAGDPKAERIMTYLNAAFQVLSDPVKRREHDEWLDHAERGQRGERAKHAAAAAAAPRRAASPPRPPKRPPGATPRAARGPSIFPAALARVGAFWQRQRRRLPPWALPLVRRIERHRTAAAVAGAVLLLLVGALGQALLTGSQAVATAPLARAAAPAYKRPAAAPNGSAWPAVSGYVGGYPVKNAGGHSEVLIDNGAKRADVFVKLASLDASSPEPVRTLFVRARDKLRIAGLAAGTYDVRYRNLADGRLARSQFFILEEVITPEGPHVDRRTVTLHEGEELDSEALDLRETEF